MLWLGGGGCEPLPLLRGIDPHTGSRVPHQLEPFRAGAPDQRPSFLTGDVPPFVALVLVAYQALGSVPPPSPDFRFDQLVSEVIEEMGEQANDPTYIGFSCIADQYQRKVRIANKLLI